MDGLGSNRETLRMNLTTRALVRTMLPFVLNQSDAINSGAGPVVDAFTLPKA